MNEIEEIFGNFRIKEGKALEFIRAVLELDEEEIKECMPEMRYVGDGFWPIVHSVRANYRLSGASMEQVQESLSWLKTHGQNEILDGFWQDEIEYRISESSGQEN